jgi:hypothetical protein
METGFDCEQHIESSLSQMSAASAKVRSFLLFDYTVLAHDSRTQDFLK